MRDILLLLLLLIFSVTCSAQEFTHQDTLRGSITPERVWWDLTYYHLDIEIFPRERKIKGSNIIQYQVIDEHQVMQLDLQAPMRITKIVQGDDQLDFETIGNAHFVRLNNAQVVGSLGEIKVYFEGKPKVAIKAPWDGGISWAKDQNGKDFIASSCQGLGASVWWPCKDHMYDEVDSMKISVEVPEHLTNVSNGRLMKVDHNAKKKTKTYHHAINNPINNYGVNINIGDYVHWSEVYQGENGDLDLFYYALKDDLIAAKKQFQQVPLMLDAFEYWFGPYPFYADGYKLVQAPYLGMEHQSSITYGNGFKNGYRGTDLSATGWGLKFDFIIIHESGHEWFANNITHTDQADMWIHESFTNYSESLYLDYHYGKDAGQEYVRGTRMQIQNDVPLIANYDVNDDSYSLDVYYKGGNMLNTLRTIVNDDEQWRGALRGLNNFFYHQTVGSKQVEQFLIDYLDLNLNSFFNQYLRDRRLPVFEYYVQNDFLFFRWTDAIESFDMVVDVQSGDEKIRLQPTTTWSSIPWKMVGDIIVDKDYYIGVLKSR